MGVSVWLLPEASVGAALDAAIDAIARESGKAAFAAHLTLASGPGEAALDPQDIFAGFSPVTLERDGVLATALFTRAFALRFAATAPLMELAEAAAELLGNPDQTLPFIPHVSLTYGEIADRSALEALAVQFAGPMTFDRVCVVAYGGTVATQADVAALAPGAVYPLGG